LGVYIIAAIDAMETIHPIKRRNVKIYFNFI